LEISAISYRAARDHNIQFPTNPATASKPERTECDTIALESERRSRSMLEQLRLVIDLEDRQGARPRCGADAARADEVIEQAAFCCNAYIASGTTRPFMVPHHSSRI
jgi:hypothetical protein